MRIFQTLLFLLLFRIAMAQQANDYFNQARDASQNNDHKTALKKINAAFRLDSSVVDYYFIKAYTLKELKQYAEALETYNLAIVRFPSNSALYHNRGNLFTSYGEFDTAISDYNKAVELAEDDSSKYLSISVRATPKIMKRDFEGAYADLIEAYNFDSTEIVTLTNLGTICDELGRGDETLKYLLKAIEIDPNSYPAYGNIGFKYLVMGEYEKAIEYFNKVLEFNPEEPLGFSNRSFCKLRLGDLRGAMKDINKSISLYPENPYAYRNRALIFIEMNKIPEACEDFQNALTRGFTISYGDEVIEMYIKYCSKNPNN